MSTYQLVLRFEADTDADATVLAEEAVLVFEHKPESVYAFNKLEDDAQVSGEEPADSE